MDIYEDEDLYKLEELSSYSTYIALKAKSQDTEAMQEAQGKTPKKLKNILSSSSNQKNPSKGNRTSDEIKAHAVHLVDIHPRNSARAVALELKLEPKTVQRWYKTWKEDPDSLFKAIGRPRIIEPEDELEETTKSLVSDFYYKNPTATIDQLMDQLNNTFKDLSVSKRTLYFYMSDLWMFSLKKVQLEPAERNTPKGSKKEKSGCRLHEQLYFY